ncbi:CU044_2847 family protein [Streptomyces sp. NPDC057686]|uniref:CU044_2847 family protein n=1 Tax=Streptomyces sp. NPDC057686 TaxID=3346212 RepID=UPI0036C1D376
MTQLARILLADGGSLLVEAPAAAFGLVKAGRLGDVIHELSGSLQSALGSVTEGARSMPDQLREASSDALTVEFGADLASGAGAVIAKRSTNCRLRVVMAGKQSGHPGPDTRAG